MFGILIEFGNDILDTVTGNKNIINRLTGPAQVTVSVDPSHATALNNAAVHHQVVLKGHREEGYEDGAFRPGSVFAVRDDTRIPQLDMV